MAKSETPGRPVDPDLLTDQTVVFQRCASELKFQRFRNPALVSPSSIEDVVIQELPVASKLGKRDTESRFHYVDKIGEGANGDVYCLLDRNCDREVAVKVPKMDGRERLPEEMDRFLAEGSTVAKLEHPGVIPVYDLNMDTQGRLYLCMRKVTGSTLRSTSLICLRARDLGVFPASVIWSWSFSRCVMLSRMRTVKA